VAALVGASLAIALESTGLDVALLEATAAGSLPAVFDERNLSFADATVNALTALGVLENCGHPAHRSGGSMSAAPAISAG
jgi:2-octaprenyl-6-methoxyphenol hydroxylase